MISRLRNARPRQIVGEFVSGLGWVILVGFGLVSLLFQLASGRLDELALILGSHTEAWFLLMATASVLGLLGVGLIKVGRRLRTHKVRRASSSAPQEAMVAVDRYSGISPSHDQDDARQSPLGDVDKGPTTSDREPVKTLAHRRSRNLKGLIALAVLVAAGGLAFAAYGLGRSETRREVPRSTGGTSSSPESPRPSPSTSPVLPSQRPEVMGSFHLYNRAEATGKRVSLIVYSLERHHSDCKTAAIKDGGGIWQPLYLYACTNWTPLSTYQNLQFFYVGIRNVNESAVRFRLNNFLLKERGSFGRLLNPRSVRSNAGHPENFLPRTFAIPPGEELSGYLTFLESEVYRPRELSYIDEGQTLTIVFPGRLRTYDRS